MSREFTLAALVPDPITVRVGEETYPARTADVFGVEEIVRMDWLKRELESLQAEMADHARVEAMSKDEQLALAGSITNIVNDIVQLIIPTLPTDRLPLIPFARKLGLFQFWTTEMEKAHAGEGRPGRGKKAVLTPARRSPAS